jgi:hypothetical protein
LIANKHGVANKLNKVILKMLDVAETNQILIHFVGFWLRSVITLCLREVFDPTVLFVVTGSCYAIFKN